MSSFDKISLPTIPAKDKLDSVNGLSGLRQFLLILKPLLVLFGQIGTQFLERGPSVAPKQPHIHDQFHLPASATSPSPSSSTPPQTPSARSLLDDLSREQDQHPFTAPPSPSRKNPFQSTTPFLYDHLDTDLTQLSKTGMAEFKADYKIWLKDMAAHEKLERQCFSFIWSGLLPSVHELLKTAGETFDKVLAAGSVLGLRLLLDETLGCSSSLRTLSTLIQLVSTRQDSLSLPEFVNTVQENVNNAIAAFGDPNHPGLIDMNHVHSAILLVGLNHSHSEFRNTFLHKTPNIQDATPHKVISELRQWDSSSKALSDALHQGGKRSSKGSDLSKKPLGGPSLKPHLYGLATPIPSRKSTFSPSYPHSVPRYNGKTPNGDSSLPHCSHCALIGYIRNNHAQDTCFDYARLQKLRAQPTPSSAAIVPVTPTPSSVFQTYANASISQENFDLDLGDWGKK